MAGEHRKIKKVSLVRGIERKISLGKLVFSLKMKYCHEQVK